MVTFAHIRPIGMFAHLHQWILYLTPQLYETEPRIG